MQPNWFDMCCKPHERTFAHDGLLSSLPTDRERELAAFWQLEAHVNNGGYLQFICNWGRESYVCASQALKKIGAIQMAEIVDQCQMLVDEHWSDSPLDYRAMVASLPKNVADRILHLSYEFMDYPEDVAALGTIHYQKYIRSE